MPPIATLNAYSIVVTLIALLLGILTQVQNTGKLFGQWSVPSNVMVYLMLVAPFLGGVSASLAQSHDLSAVSDFNAVVAGIVAVLGGATPGVVVHAALHAHLVVPKLAAALRKLPANDNANANAVAQKPAA